MGLLDSLSASMANPVTMGLLSSSAGMLNASGPSRMPISTGQVLGQGLSGLSSGYQGAIQNVMMLQKMKMLQSMFANGQQQNPQPQQQPGVDPASVQPALSAGASATAADPITQGLLGGNAPAGPGPTNYASSMLAQAPQAQNTSGMLSDPSLEPIINRLKTSNLLGIPDTADQLLLQNALTNSQLTPEQKLASDPRFGQQYIQKQTYTPPTRLGNGAFYVPGQGLQGLPAVAPPGYMNQFSPNGQASVQPITNGLNALYTSGRTGAAASTVGSGKAVDAQGNPLPLTTPIAGAQSPASALTAPLANNNPGALMPAGKLATFSTPQAGLAALDQNLQSYGQQGVNTIAGVITKWAPPGTNNTASYINDVASRLGINPNQPIDLSNPVQRQAIGTAIMLHENGPSAVFSPAASSAVPYGAPPLGAVQKANASAINPQTELSKQWADQQAQNSQAQNIKSYLQMIKAQAAIASKAPFPAVGPGSGWGDVANGVASTVLPNALGVTQRATNAVTANDLMAKYANQIIGRMSVGDMGTDAGKAINTLATPGSHMSLNAINEAADNLSAAQDMVQARTQVLAPFGNSRNQQGYQQAAQTFDQNADPTLIQTVNQYKALQPGSPQAKAFLQNATKADPTLMKRMQVLSGIGAF